MSLPTGELTKEVSEKAMDPQYARRAKWIGFGFMIVGALAIALPTVFTIAFELFVGILLILSGVGWVFSATTGHRPRFWWLVLMGGLLSTILGIVFLLNPFEGAAVLTIFLGVLMLLSGIFRLIYSIDLRKVPGARWGILDGALALLIALLIFFGWPSSALWAIGLLLGIDFVFFGLFLVMLAARSQPQNS